MADEKAASLSSLDVANGALVDGTSETIYIDPEKEKAVLRKFDKFLLPQAFLFILLNYLDRSNLGMLPKLRNDKSHVLTLNRKCSCFRFRKRYWFDWEPVRRYGHLVLRTLYSVWYVLFLFLCYYSFTLLTSTEVFWVTAVKKYGPNYVITFALVGWCSATIGTGFVQNYSQALACRMILGAFEAGVAPCFGFIFSTIYARESTAKRIALINLANVTSGAFGGLFAWGIQQMGTQRGLEAWRWLFIIEGSASLAICGGLLWTFPNKPETAWFLNEDEKALMRLRKQRDAFFKGTDEFEWKWVKAALADPFIYVASIAFFTSSVAIFGFGTFLPTILKGLPSTSPFF